MRRLRVVLLALLILIYDAALHKACTGGAAPPSSTPANTTETIAPMPPLMLVQTTASVEHGHVSAMSIDTDYVGFSMSYSTIELMNHQREATGGSGQLVFRYPLVKYHLTPYVGVGGGYAAGWGHAHYSIGKTLSVGVKYAITDLSSIGVNVAFSNDYHTPLFRKPDVTYGLSYNISF